MSISLPGKLRGLSLRRPASRYWLTFLLCALTAALIFLPFQIIDGGFFHYAGDFNSQQITFYRYMNAFVKSGGTFSWATDLGSGAANAYSFYLLGSPFFWLSLVFPAAWLPYLMCPLLVLKFGVAGGGAYLYLRRYAKDPNYAVVGACLYALSGFSLYNIFFNHFVDVVALFPYLLWALDETVLENRRGLFAAAAALNLLNSYFFFAGQILFLAIYFVCKVLTREYRLTRRCFAALVLESVLAACMGCVLAWPAVLSLSQNPRTVDLSSGWGFLAYGRVQQYLAILLSWVMPPDSPYLCSIWSEGTIKWTSMTAYLPLCSLSGVIAYWKARRGGSIKKILGVCAVCALVPVLNSAFYCLNSSYYARWYYMPVLIMALATMKAMEETDIPLDDGIRPVLCIIAATLAFAVVPVQDDTTDSWSFGVLENAGEYFAVFFCGAVGVILFWMISEEWRGQKIYPRRLLAGILAFSCIFGVCHIGIGKFGQWDTDSDLVAEYKGALALKEVLPAGDYRIDTYDAHDNLGLWLDKSSLEYFGSTAAPSILSFYPQVGVTRDVRSQPAIALYALRGLLSVQYMVVPEAACDGFETTVKGRGWQRTDIAAGGFVLYQNENYVPMGFTYGSYVTQEQFDSVGTDSRGNLLMKAILLSDEQIAQYGSLLSALPDSALQQLDYDSYVQDCSARRSAACSSFVMSGTGFTASITLDRENLVFFSVPYDDGFSASVNGKPAEILRVDNGMMAVDCPAGTNTITFIFHTAGLKTSTAAAAAGGAVFAGYLGWLAWRRRRQTLPAAPKTQNGEENA